MTRKLLSALLLFLVLTGCGGGADRKRYVGRVNDRLVTYDEYISGVRSEFETFRLSHNATPNTEQRRQLAEKAWQDIVRSIVLQEQYLKNGINATEAEVYDSLLTYPPDFILQSTRLQINGRFDPALYEKALRTGDPVDLEWLKRHYFTSYLPYRKLQRLVLNTIPVTPAELQTEYNVQHGHARIELFYIPVSSMPEPMISQPEIADWYTAHQDSFRIPPSCTLQWVQFPIIPSRADSQAAYTRIDSLYQRLVIGDSFASLARRFSSAPSAGLGGDIGFVDVDSLPPAVSREMEVNEWQMFCHPFRRGTDWVIYRPVKKTRNLVKMQEIVVSPKASAATKEAVLNDVITFRELAEEVGMKRAAREYELPLQKADNLSLDHPNIPGLGRSERLISRAIELDPNTLLEPLFHEASGSYLQMEVLNNTPDRVNSLTDVGESIATRLRSEKRYQAAYDAAVALARLSNPLAEAMAKGYETSQIDDFTLQTTLHGTTTLNRNILLQDNGKWSVYTIDDATLISVRVVSFSKPDPKGMDSEKQHLVAIVRAQKTKGYFEEWIQEQIDRAKVKDWRPKLPINE